MSNLTAGSWVGAESPALATISSTSSLPGADIAALPTPGKRKRKSERKRRERERAKKRGRERV